MVQRLERRADRHRAAALHMAARNETALPPGNLSAAVTASRERQHYMHAAPAR